MAAPRLIAIIKCLNPKIGVRKWRRSKIRLGFGKTTHYDECMKIIARSIIVGLFCGAAAICSGAVPPINVTVLESGGKTVMKGPMNASGMFSTSTLKPGGYVVQFNSKSAPKDKRYLLVAEAGREKVVANGIPGDKLNVGVAMTIKVGPGANLMAQIAPEDKNSAPVGRNGQLMVWIPKMLGSNIAPHWAESDSAEAKTVMTSTSYSRKNIQSKQMQGVSPLNDSAGKMSTANMTNPSTGYR